MSTLRDQVDADLRSLIEAVLQAHDCGDDAGLWRRLAELGLGELTGREERGGSGATWREAAELVRALARRGCDLPVGESDLVAGRLLDEAGVAAATPALRGWAVEDGEEVPAASHPLVERMVVLRWTTSGWRLADVPAGAAPPGAARWHEVSAETVDRAHALAALVRAVQITGAMEAVLDLAVEHARTREQFGRPVGKFQAVQGLLATLAAEVALARSAVDAAVLVAAAPATPLEQLLASVAVARSCAGHAAEPVVRNAHQVVGAIGTTQEHPLPGLTRRILGWRSADGGTRAWDRAVLQDSLDGVSSSALDLFPEEVEERS
ncbi:acyl-CoA dehydrogenase family protein [Amycolatopsis tucumanensis]|uniref:acyl-CoA dehydrogenase family protein n=1 Tax=Amycolatopsis tucumanensis TaxID=401106 RepID=UPI003D722210